MKYTKSLRLIKKNDFLAVKKQKKTLFGSYIIIDKHITNFHNFTRLGITASKKYGKSHERNRFKRLVREAFRLNYQELKKSLDIVIKPRISAKTATMQEIANDLITLLSIKN